MNESTKQKLLEGASKELERARLDWFEKDRLRIAKAISEKSEIPLSEFENTEETSAFHFITLTLALSSWIIRTGNRDSELRDSIALSDNGRLARRKLVAGILVRLLSHKFKQDLGSIPNLTEFLEAFGKFAGCSYSMTMQVLSAYSYVKQAALAMALQLQKGESEMSMAFFDGHTRFLENDKDRFVPRDAVIDAALQIHQTLTFIHETPGLPVSIKNLPDEPEAAFEFLRNYMMLAGLGRRPVLVNEGAIDFEDATLSRALDSYQADAIPWVLLDSNFERDGELSFVLPFVPPEEHNLSLKAKSWIESGVPDLPANSIHLLLFPQFEGGNRTGS